jgi:hypothetical protein
MLYLVVFSIIALHAPDGREIAVNPAEITSLREARPDDTDDRYFAKGVRCQINLTDGKYVAVIEECAVVRGFISSEIKRLQQIEQDQQ